MRKLIQRGGVATMALAVIKAAAQNLSPDIQQKIFRDNARELFGIR